MPTIANTIPYPRMHHPIRTKQHSYETPDKQMMRERSMVFLSQTYFLNISCIYVTKIPGTILTIRNSSAENNSTEIAEGRYIKGDPLKGYYDFVITEGSYKFWAAFQVNL